MTLSNVYKKSIKKRWQIKINTKHPDGDSYYGLVLKETRSFIVMASFSELEYDGITVECAPKVGHRSVKGLDRISPAV